MTRAIFTWFAGVGLLACTQTTRLHMEEVEDNGGAAGEGQTADADANTGGSSADVTTAGEVDEATNDDAGVGGSVSDGH